VLKEKNISFFGKVNFLFQRKVCGKRKEGRGSHRQKQKINYGHRLTQINTDDKNQRG
jgi:hypothetical protein